MCECECLCSCVCVCVCVCVYVCVCVCQSLFASVCCDPGRSSSHIQSALTHDGFCQRAAARTRRDTLPAAITATHTHTHTHTHTLPAAIAALAGAPSMLCSRRSLTLSSRYRWESYLFSDAFECLGFAAVGDKLAEYVCVCVCVCACMCGIPECVW